MLNLILQEEDPEAWGCWDDCWCCRGAAEFRAGEGGAGGGGFRIEIGGSWGCKSREVRVLFGLLVELVLICWGKQAAHCVWWLSRFWQPSFDWTVSFIGKMEAFFEEKLVVGLAEKGAVADLCWAWGCFLHTSNSNSLPVVLQKHWNHQY
jgi:hypothetical protein